VYAVCTRAHSAIGVPSRWVTRSGVGLVCEFRLGNFTSTKIVVILSLMYSHKCDIHQANITSRSRRLVIQ